MHVNYVYIYTYIIIYIYIYHSLVWINSPRAILPHRRVDECSDLCCANILFFFFFLQFAKLTQARGIRRLVDVRDLEPILVHLVKLHSRSIGLDQMLSYVLEHLVHSLAGFARRFVYARYQIVTLFATVQKSNLSFKQFVTRRD